MYEKLLLQALENNAKLQDELKNLNDRVLILENTIEELKKYHSEDNDNLENSIDIADKKKITRNTSRLYTIEKLKEHNPDIYFSKGNRASKADILMQCKNVDEEKKIKFYHSKSHLAIPSGWHTILKADIDSKIYDIHIFLVEYRSNFYNFIFTNDELKELVSKKKLEANDIYHLYLRIYDDKFIDARDNINLDVSEFYERWDLPTKILKNK